MKDTSKYRANTFGFYSINGKSVVDFQDHSRKENIIFFLKTIRESNPEKSIMIILDNFRSHHSKAVKESAESLNIKRVFTSILFLLNAHCDIQPFFKNVSVGALSLQQLIKFHDPPHLLSPF